jgi:hypothetical protein
MFAPRAQKTREFYAAALRMLRPNLLAPESIVCYLWILDVFVTAFEEKALDSVSLHEAAARSIHPTTSKQRQIENTQFSIRLRPPKLFIDYLSLHIVVLSHRILADINQLLYTYCAMVCVVCPCYPQAGTGFVCLSNRHPDILTPGFLRLTLA